MFFHRRNGVNDQRIRDRSIGHGVVAIGRAVSVGLIANTDEISTNWPWFESGGGYIPPEIIEDFVTSLQ